MRTATILCALLVTILFPRSGSTQAPCPCDPPISASATAAGKCHITQDDGKFCDINFTNTQTRNIIQSRAFGEFTDKLRNLVVPNKQLVSVIDRLEQLPLTGQSQLALAELVQAVVVVAAFQRRADPVVQRRFQDILEVTDLKADPERKQPVAKILEHFGSAPVPGPETRLTDKVRAMSGVSYDLAATRGCVAFLEAEFIFMLRGVATAAPCGRRPNLNASRPTLVPFAVSSAEGKHDGGPFLISSFGPWFAGWWASTWHARNR